MLIKSDVIVQQKQIQEPKTTNENSIPVKNEKASIRTTEITSNVGIEIGDDGKNESDHQKTRNFRNFERRTADGSSLSDITEIGSHLLLCGAVALRGNILEDLNVTCVINATNELPDTPLPSGSQKEILYLRVSIDDKIDAHIFPWLDLVTDLIHQVKMAGGKTLIHCVAGISRSAALCMAYLVRYEGYTLNDSYFFVKSLRRNIRPNSGFFGQLVKFEKEITGKQTVTMVHSQFTDSWIPQIYEDDYKKFEDLKRCRIKVQNERIEKQQKMTK